MGRLARRAWVVACALGTILVVAGCTGAAAPSVPGASATPPVLPSVGAAPSPSTSAPSASPPDGVACSRDTFDTSVDGLMAAIGNPDTNAPSEASAALDRALAGGDPAAIRAAAAVVLDHLAAAHALVAAPPVTTDEQLVIACREWEEMLGDIEDGVARMRDGGVAGAAAEVEAGRAVVAGALQDHFWQAFRPGDPTLLVETTLDGRTASASRSRLGMGAGQAFDGLADTAWSAGDAVAPQWIEIDLGWPATVAGLRLTAFQDVDGDTAHVVAAGPGPGELQDVTTLAGTTGDGDVLIYDAPAPLDGVRVLRVTTTLAPGMIGWREIEVVLAPGSSPVACDPSERRVPGLVAGGGPPREGTTPDMAVDGDPSTAWDPGPSGSFWLDFGPTRVAAFRVLVGDVPEGAPGWSAAVFDGAHWVQSGHVAPADAVDGWLTLPGPAPCVAVSGLQLMSYDPQPNPPIREVEVLGEPAP